MSRIVLTGLGRTSRRLTDISPQDAAAYIDARQGDRPWLAAASGCRPEVQRVFAALDQGGGHGHIRHEGWVTEEMNRRRAAAYGETSTAKSRPDWASRRRALRK